jgi:rod shape-determining protein MreC
MGDFRNRERRWRSLGDLDGDRRRPSRALLVALLLASASLIALDHQGGEESPLGPARQATGELFGPLEAGVAAVVRPIGAVPDWFRSRGDLRAELSALESENAQLRSRVATSDFDRNRLEEYDGLTTAAENLGFALVPARVIAVGPSQSFSRTVTIDAGSDAGLHADLTVVNDHGLVGRVLRVTRDTATVLLVIDSGSVVGGRVGSSMEMGFLEGRGAVGDSGLLDLELVDQAEVPAKHDVVVTWGSEGGAPYVSGVPVGRVTAVYSSLRETAQRAEIEPFVDFAALDLVGVVVPSGTASDRAVIEADGSLQ